MQSSETVGISRVGIITGLYEILECMPLYVSNWIGLEEYRTPRKNLLGVFICPAIPNGKPWSFRPYDQANIKLFQMAFQSRKRVREFTMLGQVEPTLTLWYFNPERETWAI